MQYDVIFDYLRFTGNINDNVKENKMIRDLVHNFSNIQYNTNNIHNVTTFPLMLLAIILCVGILVIASTWKIFQKAKRPGWAAIIPIYNTWVLFEISGKPGWWALFSLLTVFKFTSSTQYVLLIPYFVLYVIAMIELSKRFGKDTTFTIFGLIIFPFVGLPVLGFGDAKYKLKTRDNSDLLEKN